jgi:hypothetical protein
MYLTMDDETFIRGLADALPEAFAGRDLREEYFDDGVWLRYIALPHARSWIEDNAIRVAILRQHVTVLREDALRRFFDYVEQVADGADDATQTLLMIELFEGTVWTEDVREYLGPHTQALLEEARVMLAWCSGAVGRWPEHRQPRKRRR